MLNFAIAPFMLLYSSEGIEAWRRLQWYGLWMVFGSMMFFYGGGTRLLKGMQAKRVRDTNANATGTISHSTLGSLSTVPPVDLVFRNAEKLS